MNVKILFFSYLRDLTGCGETTIQVPEGTSVDTLHEQLIVMFPKLGPMKKCTLIAVGLDYQSREYVLKQGDEVAFFPPVQGG